MTTTDSEMMEDPVRPVIDDELVDRLMAQVDAQGLELLGPEGVLTELTSRILSRGLEVEMADHLGYEKGDPAGWGSGNNRNGSYPKTVQTDAGTVGVEMPRDRNATFEPQLIAKHQRRLRGFNELVISLVARGMTTRDTRAHLQEIYGVEVSAELISKVTDAIVPELRAWQQRPLDAVYPILYLDAIVVKVRTDHVVVNRGVYIAMAVDVDGRKHVLGLWLGKGDEGAKFWLGVITELKNRGVTDVLVVGLVKFTDVAPVPPTPGTPDGPARRPTGRSISKSNAATTPATPESVGPPTHPKPRTNRAESPPPVWRPHPATVAAQTPQPPSRSRWRPWPPSDETPPTTPPPWSCRHDPT